MSTTFSAPDASAAPPRLQWYEWPALDVDTLHAFLRLRVDIFVVEQQCPYPEIDGLDPRCRHLCARDPDGHLIAYLRLLPPGLKAEHPALGRLVVAARHRRGGLGRLILEAGLVECARLYPHAPVFLSGQQHLKDFYASAGFRVVSEPYLEDGIPHVDMLRAGAPQAG